MNKMMLISVFLASLLILTGCNTLFVKPAPARFTPSAWGNRSLVLTSYGFVRGKRGEAGTWVWKGIPFARPPVGELRWKAPRDIQPWFGTRNAFDFCSSCTQIDLAFKGVSGREDCLYLNIWRPETPETGLPVYVWIHGGRNCLLSSSFLPSNHGHALASQSNMVFVSMNYRLGPFGWFSHPALKENRSPEDDSGNYGTLDIIHALRWIRENISAFGGDPENVLIASGAGGGRNILSLIISPLAKNLFSKAMCQSGLPILKDPDESRKTVERLLSGLLIRDRHMRSEQAAKEFIKTMTNEEIRKYLRSKSKNAIMGLLAPGVEELLKIPTLLTDGYVIPREGYSRLENGTYANKVPLIIGSNNDEIKLLLSFVPKIDWKSDAYQATGKYGSLLFKAKGVDELAGKLSDAPDQPPVYAYRFSWGSPDKNGNSPLPEENGKKLGAFFALEVPFFLGTDIIFNSFLYSSLFTRKNQAGRKALSSAMMQYVSAFTRTGNPNSGNRALPGWKPWSNIPGDAKYIVFDVNDKIPDIFMSEEEVTRDGIHGRMKNEMDQSMYDEVNELIKNLVE